MNEPRRVSTMVLTDGLAQATTRLREADLSEPEGFHSLFEALAWVGVVRERLKVEELPVPATLNGLYFVRNLVLHQGADVVLLIAGTYGTATYGSARYGGDLHVFPPRKDLPKGQSNAGSSDYDKHVAGDDVHSTLARAVEELKL